MIANAVTLRKADPADLDRINTLIDAAMDTWQLSERAKRLSRSLYHYDVNDLEFTELSVAETQRAGIVGIIAIEAADVSESSPGLYNALLHGIYVDPACHRQGIGTRLLEHAQTMASSRGFGGMLVKAKAEARTFFEVRGFENLRIENASRDYPYRYWKPV